MITSADMTLYNQVAGPDGPVYFRTYLYGVNWQDVKKAVAGNNGLITEDRSEIFVPFDVGVDKEYCKPVAYRKADKDAYFTFGKGDVVVRDIIDFELTTDKDCNLKTLQNTFDDVMIITAIPTHDNGSPDMQHWELEAKS